MHFVVFLSKTLYSLVQTRNELTKNLVTGAFVCLFDLNLYFPVNNLSVTSGRVFLG